MLFILIQHSVSFYRIWDSQFQIKFDIKVETADSYDSHVGLNSKPSQTKLFILFIYCLTKCLEKKLDGNYEGCCMLFWINPWKQQLLESITSGLTNHKTRYAGYCWRSKDELISNILLRTPTHGHTSVSQPAKT